jgi:hypothetical protein
VILAAAAAAVCGATCAAVPATHHYVCDGVPVHKALLIHVRTRQRIQVLLLKLQDLRLNVDIRPAHMGRCRQGVTRYVLGVSGFRQLVFAVCLLLDRSDTGAASFACLG